jgi:hypothetical protein
MKKINCFNLLLVLVVAIAGSASAQTLIGDWDFNGTPVTKTVDSVMADAGYPYGGFVSESRTVLEDPDGDVVFGKPRENATAFPSLSADGEGASGMAGDTALINQGALAQSSYIGGALTPITGSFKVAFDFKLYEPENWANGSTMTIMLDGAFSKFSIRLVTAASGDTGMGKVQFYVFKDVGNTLLESGYFVDMADWNHLECWVQNGVVNVDINGNVTTAPLGGSLATVNPATTYDGMTIAARWDGGRYYARLYFDNLELYQLTDGCGSWGYLPTDFNEDCVVDLDDLKTLLGAWLDCTDPQGVGCSNLLQ